MNQDGKIKDMLIVLDRHPAYNKQTELMIEEMEAMAHKLPV